MTSPPVVSPLRLGGGGGGGTVPVAGVLRRPASARPAARPETARRAVATSLTLLAERRTTSLSIGRWSASLTMETTTGVMAAANTVPSCQRRETTTAAIPDATAATTSVCRESPSPCLLAFSSAILRRLVLPSRRDRTGRSVGDSGAHLHRSKRRQAR